MSSSKPSGPRIPPNYNAGLSRLAGCIDLLTTPKATRTQGLQLMLKSEKGQHLGMPILDYRQVCTHPNLMQGVTE